MAVIYKAHGEVINNFEPKNGTDFSLSELNAIVCGHIEIISILGGKYMVINEEGKLKNLAINWPATKIFQDSYGKHDVIVGDALVCDIGQIK